MGIIDKFKGIINPDDMNGSYDDGGDEYIFSDDNRNDYGGYEGGEYQTATATQQLQQQSTANFNTQRQNQNTSYTSSGNLAINGSALDIKVVKPKQYREVNGIADHLISRRTVVLNLEDANTETTHRMLDFLLGVVYTIEGDIKKVSNNTYVITPSSVTLSQDQQDSKRDSYNMN